MTAADPTDAALAELLGPALLRDHPLGPLCTYRVGGAARWFVEIHEVETLTRLAAVTSARDVATLVIGRGSNLLVSDAGFDGIAVQLGESFSAIEIADPDPGADEVLVVAGGATSLPVLARRCVAAGVGGFEWAVGVPGSVGGAVRMNAGGHGSDIAASLVGVRVVDLATGEDVEVAAAQLDLTYRHSSLTATQVVVSATFRLPLGDRRHGEAELSDIVAWRRANQPGGPNAGSVFTNPADDSAGRLIDAAGGKGRRIGTASVSDKHANFIQADPGGRADDIVALMADIRRMVSDTSGIDLQAETRLVGFSDTAVLAAGGRTP